MVEGSLVSDSPVLSGSDHPIGCGNEVSAPVGADIDEIVGDVDSLLGGILD